MKTTIFLFLLTFFGILQAQKNHSFTFNHLALSVKDLDESATFYKEVLELTEITNKAKLESIRWFLFWEEKRPHLISFLKELVTIYKAVHLALNKPNFDAFVKTLETRKSLFLIDLECQKKINILPTELNKFYFKQ